MAITKIGTPELFDFSATNTALQLPTGDTASRPSAPSAGQWRFNTTVKYVEYWDGGAWRQIDTEALPLPADFNEQNFNVNTYFGTGAAQTIDAKFNEAANFNGSSSLITLPDSSVISQQNNFTISFWVKPNGFVSFGTVLTLYSDYRNYVDIRTNGILGFDATGSQVDTPSSSITDGVWQHIAITKSSTAGTVIYVNANAVATDASDTGNATDFTSNSYPNTMGAYKLTGSASDFFPGSLDQVRIFNTALPATGTASVATLYAETTTTAATLNFPAGAGCTAAYQLDGDASDLSGNYNGATTDIGFTGLQFQPDLVWIKTRSAVEFHALYDSVRGIANLTSNSSNAQGTNTTMLTSLNTNGFSLGTDAPQHVNVNGRTYVAWCFKGGGAPTTDNVAGVGNVPTSGSVKVDAADSTAALTGTIVAKKISANTNSGFSIVQYDGTGTAGTIDHLLGVVPNLVIVKRTDDTGNWIVGSIEIDSNSWQKILQLDLTEATYSGFNNTPPTSSVFSLGSNNPVNNGSGNYIAYCFANKNGYQRVGTYTGNNSEYGPMVYTTSDGTATGTDGFEPAFVLIKKTGSGFWVMLDNKRNTVNPRNSVVYANATNAESTAQATNFYSNGFQPVTTDSDVNAAANYIYLAIGSNPAPTPTLANSLKTVAYTGDSVNGRSVNDVGFLPQFTWIKNLGNNLAGPSESHVWIDQLRYPTNIINSNEAIAQYNNTSSSYQSFIGNGFTLGNDGQVNSSGANYISYSWKGASIPTINNAGTITSVTSVNDAAGFSIVAYKGTGANATVGHGLQTAPQLILFKAAGASVNWVTYNVHSTATKYMSLNLTFGDYSSAIEFQDTEPTGGANGVITLGSSGNPNNATYPMVAYCFHDILGYQKVGTYNGTGASLNQINVGFAPSVVIFKCTSNDGTGWRIFDTTRGTDSSLTINNSNSQYVDTAGNYVDFTSSGFEFNNTGYTQQNPDLNGSSRTYIYLAIK